jgi:hypothetical protein
MTACPFDAADLCAYLVHRLDGARTETDHTLYAYGAGSHDAVLPGRENTTTILADHVSATRWFMVEVRQFWPDRTPARWLDHEVLRSLTSRAQQPPVPFTLRMITPE